MQRLGQVATAAESLRALRRDGSGPITCRPAMRQRFLAEALALVSISDKESIVDADRRLGHASLAA